MHEVINDTIAKDGSKGFAVHEVIYHHLIFVHPNIGQKPSWVYTLRETKTFRPHQHINIHTPTQ